MNALEQKVGALVGEPVAKSESVSGGDINEARLLTLTSGRKLFAKTHRAPLPGLFLREAEGLAWLAEPLAVRVPRVVVASDVDDLGPACLVLEYIAPAKRGGAADSEYAEQLGRGLAALHRSGAASFGFPTANYLATLPQDNTAEGDWPSFYRERRILPLTARAEKQGHLPRGLVARLHRLCERMSEFTGPAEPPARLHGDLWGGNALAAESGEPVLIDPAVYGGHREIDLAMMRLFGGFARRVFDAYDEVFPLAEGHEERVALYQLYPLLAHVNLFGGGYIAQLERALAAYVPH